MRLLQVACTRFEGFLPLSCCVREWKHRFFLTKTSSTNPLSVFPRPSSRSGAHPQLERASSVRLAKRGLAGAKSMITNEDVHILAGPQPVEQLREIGRYKTETLELRAPETPRLQVVVIPGNPGICPYYQEYVSGLFEKLGGKADITVIGFIGHTLKSWEGWRTFSLQDQIAHKAAYVDGLIKERPSLPIVLVGHSIGAYIALELLRQYPHQVSQVIGLYPFLTINPQSRNQRVLSRITHIAPLCILASFVLALLGCIPLGFGRRLIARVFRKLWDPPAAGITSRYLLQYHVGRNITYLGKTEFDTLWSLPDWDFICANGRKIALIFGTNDHWGPLWLQEEVNAKAPTVKTIIERENHLHAFCCKSDGSKWVANETAGLILELEATK